MPTPSKAPVKPVKDRRRFSRHAVRGSARIEPLDEMIVSTRTIQVTIIDVCSIGMQLEVDRELDVNSTWRVRFIEHNFCLGTVPLAIRNCRKLDEYTYQVGGMFVIEPVLLRHLGMSSNQIQRTLLGGPEYFAAGNFTAPEAA